MEFKLSKEQVEILMIRLDLYAVHGLTRDEFVEAGRMLDMFRDALNSSDQYQLFDFTS